MEKLIKFLSTVIAIFIVLSVLYFSGVLSFHHFHIVFEDGEEYHINTLIDCGAEYITVYNFDSVYTISINDRGYEIHYCNCENSVARIDEIKEKENENLH